MWKKPAKPRETKSPLKHAPLPLPGDSLYDEIMQRLEDAISTWLALFSVLAVMAIFAWVQWFTGTRISPVFATVIAVPGCGFSIYKIWRWRSEVQNMRLGLRGEIAVAQELGEHLPPMGYRLLHDIPGDGFNVDHVAIGPGGILAIETKTVSKPARGRSEIVYDGTTVKINGLTPDRDPLDQAAGNARFIAQTIFEETGVRPMVHAVVLYPGWYVRATVSTPAILVQNEAYFAKAIESRPRTFSTEDITKFVEALKRYVRRQREIAA